MPLDKESKALRVEVMANFIKALKNGIALFDNIGYVLFPGQDGFQGYTLHLHKKLEF